MGSTVYKYMMKKYPDRFNNKQFKKYLYNRQRQVLFKMVNNKYEKLLTDREVKKLYSIIDKNSFLFKWEKGDVLLLDNKRWAHSRMNIKLNDNRKIITCFGNMYDIRNYNKTFSKL